MNDLAAKQAIVSVLAGFVGKPLAEAATLFFESLGYKSEKRIVLKPNSAETFVATFAKDKALSPDHALLADWKSVDFLFQLTDDEVRAAAVGNQQFLFDSKGKWSGAAMESYLFFAITLKQPHYSRTELSGIIRIHLFALNSAAKNTFTRRMGVRASDYLPPPPEDVSGLMFEFLAWWNKESAKLSPVFEFGHP